jgi:hypothetical protein
MKSFLDNFKIFSQKPVDSGAGFFDNIKSLTRSMANSRNAQATNAFTQSTVSQEELRAIYKSGVGSKIIRLKSGIAIDDTLQFKSEKEKAFYNAALQAHVKKAVKFMLGFGRSIIVIHESGADLSMPLPKDASSRKGVKYHVFSGDMVNVQSANIDLSSPNYLKPISYNVRSVSIHPSRVVDFKYVEPVELEAPYYNYGGISEFELIYNELIADGVLQRAVPAVLEKSSTMFYKVKGFRQLLAEKRESHVLEYFSAIENLRSVYGAGILDQDDIIESVSQALSNLAESDMITLRRLAMVTGLPLSWLVGESAKGMNSTGEGERQVLKQTISSLQSDYLIEPINRLLRLHGLEDAEFKDNQGETQVDKMAFETQAIANALILWQMGEDYEKYLVDHDVIKRDDIGSFFK